MLQFKEGNGWKCCYDPEAWRLIHNGRHLFMSVDDRCGPPYTVILDSDYEKLCPWSTAVVSGRT